MPAWFPITVGGAHGKESILVVLYQVCNKHDYSYSIGLWLVAKPNSYFQLQDTFAPISEVK